MALKNVFEVEDRLLSFFGLPSLINMTTHAMSICPMRHGTHRTHRTHRTRGLHRWAVYGQGFYASRIILGCRRFPPRGWVEPARIHAQYTLSNTVTALRGCSDIADAHEHARRWQAGPCLFATSAGLPAPRRQARRLHVPLPGLLVTSYVFRERLLLSQQLQRGGKPVRGRDVAVVLQVPLYRLVGVAGRGGREGSGGSI